MQLLKISPDKTLNFNVDDLHSACTTKLNLANMTSNLVAFKIKTTAPKSYLVRPSAGVLEANASQDVQIILQPISTPPTEPSQDRFLVQACVVEQPTMLTREAWNEMPKELIQDQRLSVTVTTELVDDGKGGNAPVSASRPPSDYTELRTKYEELTKCCIMLEKQKKELEMEVSNLKRRGAGGSPLVKQGFELWHVALIVAVILLACRLVKLL